MGTQTELVIIT